MMIHLNQISSLLIILFAIYIDIPQVISSLSQTYDEFHDPMHGYDLDKGPVIYQAYYPDDRNSKQEKKLFYHEPIIRNSWQIHYNTRGAPTSRINIQKSDIDLHPLSSLYQTEYNRVIDDNNFHGVGSSIRDNNAALKMKYKTRINNAFQYLVENIGQKIRDSRDDWVPHLSDPNNQGRLVAKTHIEYWRLANALAHPETYSAVPPSFTAQLNARKQSIVDALTQEDIFQPRPQIINYKFSLPIKSLLKTDKLNFPIEIHEDDSVDTIINKQNNVLHLNEKPRVESIKVEGKRTRKVRHHHGENRRQIS